MGMQRWMAVLAGVALAMATARLGVWQLDRAAQKTALHDALVERAALPELQQRELASDAAHVEAQRFRRVRLHGRWRSAATVALENRQMHGRVGFFIVTPLLLDDASAVLVQRGWLPRDFQDRTKLHVPELPDAAVEVQGIVATPPARLYEFAGAASGPLRQNLDVAAFSRETGLTLRPLSVLQVDASPADGLLRDWPAPELDVTMHRGYAFQWFSLSVLTVLLLLWFQLIAPLRRKGATRASS